MSITRNMVKMKEIAFQCICEMYRFVGYGSPFVDTRQCPVVCGQRHKRDPRGQNALWSELQIYVEDRKVPQLKRDQFD